MSVRHLMAGLLAPLALAACSDNPVLVQPGDVTVELELSSDHVHTLSEITYTVTVRDHTGAYLTDFDSLTVERKAHGSDTWRATELALTGTSYTGTYTFASSGEYDLRVSGQRHGESEMAVLHEMAEHMEVGRAHEVLNEQYRVEVETFPGHLHEGDEAEVKFWVLEPDPNAEGIRPPISGLTNLQIHCVDEMHTADITEESPGVYVVQHTFAEVGETHLGLHVMHGDGSMMGEAEFTTHVVHGH